MWVMEDRVFSGSRDRKRLVVPWYLFFNAMEASVGFSGFPLRFHIRICLS